MEADALADASSYTCKDPYHSSIIVLGASLLPINHHAMKYILEIVRSW